MIRFDGIWEDWVGQNYLRLHEIAFDIIIKCIDLRMTFEILILLSIDQLAHDFPKSGCTNVFP